MSKATLNKRNTPARKHREAVQSPFWVSEGGQQGNHQRPIVFREGDTLDDFLDQIMLRLYEQMRLEPGGHSQAARLLRVGRVALYQRVARARQRVETNSSRLLRFVALIASQNS